MKTTTQNILNLLTDSTFLTSYFELKNSQPTYMFQETSLDEAYNEFENTMEMIKSAIGEKLFDTIPFNKRNQILAALNAIKQHLNHVKQFSFNITNAQVKNSSNAIIQQTTNLIDFIDSSNLYAKLIGLENYKNEITELSKIRKAYQALINNINNASELNSEIINFHTKIQDKYNSIETISSESNDNLQIIKNIKNDSETEIKSIIELKKHIKTIEEEIETKKLGINTFESNIAEYRSSIENLTNRAREIMSPLRKVFKII